MLKVRKQMVAVAGLGMALGAMAADVVWTGAGSWLDPTAWPGGVLPASSNSVDIVAGSSVTFAGSADAIGVGQVNLASTGEATPATMEVTSGNFQPAWLHVATASNAVGKVVQSGGAITIGNYSTESLSVGFVDGGIGTYELSGGSVSAASNIRVGADGNGTLLQTGGSIVGSSWLVCGYGNGGTGLYDISAGTAQLGYGLIVGEKGIGHAVIRDAGTNVMNRLGINGVSELELLPGGTLIMNYAEKQTNGTGNDGRLTLDGGSLVYRGDSAVQNNFINGTLDHVYVKDRGVTISVPGDSTVTAQKPLEAHPEASAGDVTKTGAGILRLQGANTFKGKLQV